MNVVYGETQVRAGAETSLTDILQDIMGGGREGESAPLMHFILPCPTPLCEGTLQVTLLSVSPPYLRVRVQLIGHL